MEDYLGSSPFDSLLETLKKETEVSLILYNFEGVNSSGNGLITVDLVC